MGSEHDTMEEADVDRLEDDEPAAKPKGKGKPKEKPKKAAKPGVVATCAACGRMAKEHWQVAQFHGSICSGCMEDRIDISKRLFVESFAADSGSDPVAVAREVRRWADAYIFNRTEPKAPAGES